MLMIHLRTIFGIFLLILHSECDKVCVTKKCGTERGRGHRTTCYVDVPEGGKIISVNPDSHDSDDNGRSCTENRSYGFGERSIWVSNGCKGEFEVCYITDSEEETTISTTTKRRTTYIYLINHTTTYIADTTRPKAVTDTGNGTLVNATRPAEELSRRKYTLAATIIGGVVAGLVLVVVVCVVVYFVLKRFPNFHLKPKRSELYNNHRNVTFTISGETTVPNDESENTYNTLDEYCDHNHLYQVCSSIPSIPQDLKHTYAKVYDSFSDSKPIHNGDKIHNYFTLEQEMANAEPEVKSIKRYQKLAEIEPANDGNIVQPKNENTSQSYSVLDSNETGFCKGMPTHTGARKDDLSKSISDSPDARPFCYDIAKPIPVNENYELKTGDNDPSTNSKTNPYYTLKEGVYNISSENYHTDNADHNNAYRYAADFEYSTAKQSNVARKTDANYTYYPGE